MTDKQQIEELRKFISQLCCNSNCDNCKWRHVEEGSCLDYFEATALYNANYRRVPENAVVLTREEYEWYRKQCEELNNIYSNGFRTLTEVHKLLEQTRKETAKEICITGKYYYAKHSPMERQLSDFLAHIKETYGVEVEDNGN